MKRNGIRIAVFALCAVVLDPRGSEAAPSIAEAISADVYGVRDDAGVWGGAGTGMTHQRGPDYWAKKILDLSRVPEAFWKAAAQVRLSAYFCVRDYSWHDAPARNGLDEAFEIVVNGNVHRAATNSGVPVFVENEPKGQLRWHDFALPKEEFVRGPNEIIFRLVPPPGKTPDDYLYNEIAAAEMVRRPEDCALLLVEVAGKRYAGSRDFACRPVTAMPGRQGFRAVLFCEPSGLEAALSVWIDEDLHLGLAVTNRADKPLDFKLAFPHFSGLAISGNPADDYYFFPWGGGIIADAPAIIRRGYGDHEAIYQVMDLFSPVRGGGLAVWCTDEDGRHKVLALRKHVRGQAELGGDSANTPTADELKWTNCLEAVPGVGMTYEYLRRTRKPGESFAAKEVSLRAHAGDWHAAMKLYADWCHRVWKFRPYPSRLTPVINMLARGWGQDVLFHEGKYRTDVVRPRTDCVELMSWWEWSPLGPWGTPIDQVEKKLGADGIRLDEYGHCGSACFSKLHQHTFAEWGTTEWQRCIAETTKLVRQAMDEAKPGSVLTTEHPGYDFLLPLVEGCITYDLSVQATPLRPLECNLQRFYFPECRAYELVYDPQRSDGDHHKRFWNAVGSFGAYYPVKMYAILRENEDAFSSRDCEALTPTLARFVYANRFCAGEKTVHTLYNATGHTFAGAVLKLDLRPGEHVFDLLRSLEVECAPGKDGVAARVFLLRDDVACLVRVPARLGVKRSGNLLEATVRDVAKGWQLRVCDAEGEPLATRPVAEGATKLNLAELAPKARPVVCIKLLDGPRLVDVVAVPVEGAGK